MIAPAVDATFQRNGVSFHCKTLFTVSTVMSDNVIQFRRKPIDPLIARIEALKKIMQWSSDMLKAGHMPEDVRIAFASFFGKDDPASTPRPPA